MNIGNVVQTIPAANPPVGQKSKNAITNQNNRRLDQPLSPILDLPFNGNTQDLSPYRHQVKVYGAQLTTDRFETPNSAYSFDGSSRIEIDATVSSHIPNAFTVSVFAYSTKWWNGDQSIID